MIGYAWHDEVPEELAEELEGLVQTSIAYDAEAGFSSVSQDQREAVEVQPGNVRHLLVTMPPKGSRGSPHLDRLPDVLVVAYLRLYLDGSTGWVQLVVRPEFRSLGVATLLFERLSERPDGWRSVDGLERLVGWAHGGHPAAERLSWRFEAKLDGAVFKTLLPLGGSRPFVADVEIEDRTAAQVNPEVAPRHDDGMAPADLETRRRGATRLQVVGVKAAVTVGAAVEADPTRPALVQLSQARGLEPHELRELLCAGLVHAQAEGARVAQLYVDVEDESLLHVSRELGFFHDQSDVRYALDLRF